ncbi:MULTISPECIES: hypothetical protein [unclassified Synechocystis]|uniref:hypothetical protein n=1 Tax=unclassified Synechocystis TaxID=2640012 RepID=UPI0004906C60|nr:MULTISPECIES: hypothetical protein [unclassified Synechocystis]MCT0253578.1 hypothetical protein [Synechocystis sp. CS-94]
MRKKLTRFLSLTLMLGLLWFGTGACTSQPPSQFEQAQQESTERGASAVVKESTKGGEFNAFFPQANGEYERVFAQEKQGFAEIKLKQNGQDVAVMSINDVKNNPTAADKFKQSTQAIDGFPVVQQGSTATALLVGDRYQIKVLSRSPSFTPQDREEWLGKFDLQGLENLSSRN